MSNIHLRVFTHPALALRIFDCMFHSLGMKAVRVVPACREKMHLKRWLYVLKGNENIYKCPGKAWKSPAGKQDLKNFNIK